MFGSPPKRLGYPGHPEIELALIKLWRATGKQRYFDLARFFVENRGRQFFATEHQTPLDKYDGSYWQDDVPIYDHQNIKGHAVRAAYLISGVTEVASQTEDERLLKMLDRVWCNTTERNQYITGGIGPSSHNEGFTGDYDLPNLPAYQETCATIALAQWNHRLALLYGDANYADVVERALYINELRKQYPNDKSHKKVLIPLLKKALIKAGWKPNISLIQREIKTLKKERKEELRWLKESIRKR